MILEASVDLTQAIDVSSVFRDYAPFAWRFLRRLGVPAADVDDACQEVFVTVHRKLPEFQGRSSMRTWVFGICVRVAAAHRRRLRRRREVAATEAPEPAIDAGQEHEAHVREAIARLDRILEKVDDQKRAVFVLYEIEELSMPEVAQAVGCPLQTAYSRLHAARAEVETLCRRFEGTGRST
jgi:RNA polymerase sigma-70 factor (ECF subfamily)